MLGRAVHRVPGEGVITLGHEGEVRAVEVSRHGGQRIESLAKITVGLGQAERGDGCSSSKHVANEVPELCGRTHSGVGEGLETLSLSGSCTQRLWTITVERVVINGIGRQWEGGGGSQNLIKSLQTSAKRQQGSYDMRSG